MNPSFHFCRLVVVGVLRMAPLSPETSTFSAARLGLILLAILGVLFFIFMGSAAFAPGLFAGPIVEGGTISKWFAFAFGLIWLSVLATGFYVFSVNSAEDRS